VDDWQALGYPGPSAPKGKSMEVVDVYVVPSWGPNDASIILLRSDSGWLREVFVSPLVAGAVARFLQTGSDIDRDALLRELEIDTGIGLSEANLLEGELRGQKTTASGMVVVAFSLNGEMWYQGRNPDGTRTILTLDPEEIGGPPDSPATGPNP
jgi:hypothetical protein